MPFRISVTIAPVTSGWAQSDERVVGGIGVDAKGFDEALRKAKELLPNAINDDVRRVDMPTLYRRG